MFPQGSRYRWRWPEPDGAAWARLEKERGLPPVVARVLAARGMTDPEGVDGLFQPPSPEETDPFRLRDMDKAADRTWQAVQRGEFIAVYGDYDVDGQAGTALLVSFLRALGAHVTYYVPHRLEEGYGVHAPALEELHARGVRTVVTVDCGVSDYEAAETAVRLGMALIVTDHHRPGDTLPPAVAVVNPRRADCPYSYKELAGVGVAYKLAKAVWRLAGAPRGADPDRFLDLVALGTVADVMPLTGENRWLVRRGLELMNDAPRPGIASLMEEAAVEGPVEAYHLGFVLGPRLNAGGRLHDPMAGVKLLLTSGGPEARDIAAELERLNRLRQSLEGFIVEQAHRQIEELGLPEPPAALVVAGHGWHPGVLGLVASRLVERYYRPTLVIGIEGDVARGSGRSIDGFDLYDALRECSDIMDRFGGHALAAGFSLQADRISELRERFTSVAFQRLKVPLAAGELIPVVKVDAEVSFADLTDDLPEQLNRLAPFGPGNPTPVLGIRRARIHRLRPVGRGGDHLQVELEALTGGERRRAIGFRMGAEYERFSEGDWVQVAFVPYIDTWQGQREVRMRLRALDPVPTEAVVVRGLDDGRPAEGAEAAPAVAVEDRREGTPAFAPDVARRALLAAELHEQRGPSVLVVLGEEAKREALKVWPQGAGRIVALGADGDGLFPPPPGAPVWERWAMDEPHVHLVLACLPPGPGFLESWLAGVAAAGRGPRKLAVHLVYGRGDEGRMAGAINMFYPSRDELVRCYLMWRRVLGNGHGAGEDALWRHSGDAIPWPTRRAAFHIFQEIGLLQEGPSGWVLTPPQQGRLDLYASPRYDQGEAIRRRFGPWSSWALKADPEAVVRSLLREETNALWI